MTALFLMGGTSCGRSSNGQSTEQLGDSTEQAVYNTILTRSSIRKYENKAVEKEKIEKLLRAGMAAPSAVDRRPWHLVVVTDKSKLEAIAQVTPNARSAKDAPLAIVVCGDMTKALEGEGRDFWIQDCSAMSENILLEAHALGLGAVWTGTYPSQERCEAVRKVLGLSQDLIPLNTIVIGYPQEEGQPKDKWNPDDVTYM
ncbi:MAG: nitroreductase family protein [Prevotella sp.]